MKMKVLAVIGFLTVVGCNVPALAQVDPVLRHDPSNALKAANPQMSRLAACLAGDWDSVETMERSSFFPRGGSRKGKIHAGLVSGGYTLLYKVHSNGSAGELDGFHVIWWDPKAKAYRFFACFNDAGEPCIDRGTARWEGESFVNNYYFEAGGKHIRGRDTFTFTPTTHTLVAEIESERNGRFTTLITTQAKRQ